MLAPRLALVPSAPRPLTRVATCALLALAGVALAASPSQACKKRHQTPFELYDTAVTVAQVKVLAVPPPLHLKNAPGPGDVRLEVVQLLKHPGRSAAGAAGTGPAPAAPASPRQLVSHLGGDSCDVPFAVGDVAVIFLDADGWTEGAHEGYLRAVGAWQPVIAAWSAAADDEARAAALVDAATGADAAVRQEAATHLVDAPALLARIDDAQRGRLVAQLRQGAREPELALALVRLRQRAAIASLPRWMKLARAVGAITRYEDERDPAALAAAIAAARRPAERWAAFERCERARATRLASFRRYIDDLDKVSADALAASCREGTPLEL
jgi:hypothetical protein